MTDENEEDALTIKELSRELKVSTKKLREWKKWGALKPIRLIGMEEGRHPLRYSRGEVNRFLEEHTINKPGEREEHPGSVPDEG